MEGEFNYIYFPVQDFKRAHSFYSDTLGLVESWRQGDIAAAFKLPGTNIELMLHVFEDDLPAGPIFIVPSVDTFYAEQQGKIEFKGEPITVLGVARWVAACDSEGNNLYFVDSGTSTEAQG